MPDRRGNNRVDSLRNIVRDPRVGLSADPALLDSFIMEGKAPRSVIVTSGHTVFLQCARAVLRAALWGLARQVVPGTLPTAGQHLAAPTANRAGG